MKSFLSILIILLHSKYVFADTSAFKPGKVIPEFGKIAPVPGMVPLPEAFKIKHSFDVSIAADAGDINRAIAFAARLFNVHHAAGVDVKNIKAAIVVHGGAVKDVTHDEHYRAAKGTANANIALIKALTDTGVRIIVCGQSSAYNNVTVSDLLPGVEMMLSAMTAHIVLQQEGYTLNPF